jgi:hypothetical protein
LGIPIFDSKLFLKKLDLFIESCIIRKVQELKMKTIIITDELHMTLTMMKYKTGKKSIGDVIKKLLEMQENKKK